MIGLPAACCPCPTAVLIALAVLAAGCGGAEPEPERSPPPAVAGRPAPTIGLDSALLAGAYERAGAMPRMRSLLVARHGELAGERYFHGASARDRANIKSASKSVLSALVGIAIARGELEGLDQPIGPFFERELAPPADPRAADVTVGQLLSMQAGLESTSFGNYGRWVSSPNWVRHALTRPFVAEPGGRMLYSTGSTHLLSALLTRATGSSTLDLARSWLGEPLGIEIAAWPRDPQGVYFGGNDMRLTPRAMLRFGELYRNEGRHEGVQLVPAEWVRDSWTPRTRSPYNGNRYGLGWWIRSARGYPVYFAWGYGGQFVFVVPDLGLTVVATSDASPGRSGEHLTAVHRLLSEWIVPAAERGAGTAKASAPGAPNDATPAPARRSAGPV